jgi:hypothetical protein
MEFVHDNIHHIGMPRISRYAKIGNRYLLCMRHRFRHGERISFGVRAYHRYCNKIGNMSSASDNFDLLSQLPSMILVRDLGGGFDQTGTFYYADGAYNIADAYCYSRRVRLEAKDCCRPAFSC